jgi:hypothetical protein
MILGILDWDTWDCEDLWDFKQDFFGLILGFIKWLK